MGIKIVLATWLDAATQSSWIEHHKEAQLQVIDSVGYLIYQDERVVKLAQSLGKENMFADVLVIPKNQVVKVKTLK